MANVPRGEGAAEHDERVAAGQDKRVTGQDERDKDAAAPPPTAPPAFHRLDPATVALYRRREFAHCEALYAQRRRQRAWLREFHRVKVLLVEAENTRRLSARHAAATAMHEYQQRVRAHQQQQQQQWVARNRSKMGGKRSAAAMQQQQPVFAPPPPPPVSALLFDMRFGGPACVQLKKPERGVIAIMQRQQQQQQRQGQEQRHTKDQEDQLVPIRLDIEHGAHHLRDSFTWNLNERSLTPQLFAAILCDDFKLPPNTFVPLIVQQMLQQLGDYARYAPAVLQKQREIGALVQMNDKRCAELFNMFLEEEHCDNNGVEGNPDDGDVTLTAQEHAWMCALGDHHRRHPHVLEHITKRLKATSRDNNSATPPLVELPGELRCPLRISVTVGNVQLTDRLEWDLLAGHHPLAPEFVAERLCAELGLGGEFCTAVAHSIREQVYMYSKCLALVGYAIGGHTMDGGPVLHGEMSDWFLPVMDDSRAAGFLRNASERDEWTPQLDELTEYDLASADRDRDRIARRRRRGQQRGTGGRRSAATNSAAVYDMLGFALDDGDDQAGSGAASSLDDEFGGFAVEAAIAEATGGAPASKTQKPTSSISQHALDVVLPDMTLPPKTNRSLLFRGDDATPVLPLFTGMREGDNAGDDTTSQDLTWLRKYAGTKSFAPIGSGLGADSLRASSSRRSGGGRMAAQQASAYITALASSDQRSNNDDNFAVPDRAQFFNAKSPQVTDVRVSGLSSVGGVQTSVNRSSVMEVDEALLAPPLYSYADHGVRSHWRCMGCGCSPFYTSEVLEGPLGANSLCLACGTAWINEGRSETLSRQAYDSNYLSGEQGEEISAAVVLRHTINNGRVYPLANALLPESLSTHRQRLHERFPNDYFDLVQVGNGPLRLGVSGHGPAATRGNCRVMCFDCDSRGKVYALGPAATMGNFENHLNKKAHRAAVEERVTSRSALK